MRDAGVEAARPGLIRRALGCLAINDLILLGHLAIMWALVARVPPSRAATEAIVHVELTAMALLIGCVLGRGTQLPARIRSGIYRFVAVGTVAASYLMLRGSLPVVQPGSYDQALDSIDVALFGVQPTLWLEPLMSAAVVEYLAFFYFSYFAFCALYPLVALGPGSSHESSAEFAIGTSIVYGVGQLGYVLVPGFGPTHHLEALYQGPLQGGFFWRCVLATVAAGSAMKDIFPSLHTAAPVWFTLYALRRARRTGKLAWKLFAVATGIFAANIVVSTVALRWHYVIDVAVGMILAGAAAWAAPRGAALEERIRRARGVPSAWS